MSTRTTVMGIMAVTFCVSLLMGMFFPSIEGIEEESKTETYQNTGPYFIQTADGVTHVIELSADDDEYTVTTDGLLARTIPKYSLPGTASTFVPLAVGDDSLIVLYENGDVIKVTTETTDIIGDANGGMTLTLSGKTMTYTGGSLTNINLIASETGEMSMTSRPTVLTDSVLTVACLHTTAEGTSGATGSGTTEGITLVPLDQTAGYDDISIHLEEETLDTGAVRVHAQISSVWGENTVVHDCNLIAPSEVTVEYTEPGVPDMLMNIVLAMGVLIVAAILIFTVRYVL